MNASDIIRRNQAKAVFTGYVATLKTLATSTTPGSTASCSYSNYAVNYTSFGQRELVREGRAACNTCGCTGCGLVSCYLGSGTN